MEVALEEGEVEGVEEVQAPGRNQLARRLTMPPGPVAERKRT